MKTSFRQVIRIALAQVDPTVGDLAGNAAKIGAWIGRAQRQAADLVVFPELALTGYPPEDLLLKPRFVADNIALNFEAKQIWHSSLDVTVDGEKYDYDPSDWVATIGFRVFFRCSLFGFPVEPSDVVQDEDFAGFQVFYGFSCFFAVNIFNELHWVMQDFA